MFLLAAAFIIVATFFAEIGGSVGKYAVNHKFESIYSLGFLNVFWSVIVMGGTLALRPELWSFSLASLPTLGLRIILECFQAYVSLKAVQAASRSAFAIVRSATIPLVLLADVFLGQLPDMWQLVGVAIVVGTLVAMGMLGDIERKGLGYLWVSTINSAFTLILFKYNTLNFNSVLAEQVAVSIPLLIFLYIGAKRLGESPMALMRKRPIVLIPCVMSGMNGLLESFAFAWLPLSIATTMNRALSAVWGVLFGKKYFHEVHVAAKFIAIGFIIVGFALLFV
ncbi:hypothetical protein IT087_02665 [Candidatus Uhrbacteria bacterium]|nr:hypothetical protein [Candidatus Uhrbacteria bacterium]